MTFFLLSVSHIMEAHDYVLAENELQGLAGDLSITMIIASALNFENQGLT